ncbi:MAG: hypothetical protein KGY80_09560 [Candidatus Thorarchaeota archaeon]|nr:hypothetical protein [Candidatus Thorarchaeota archaeon]
MTSKILVIIASGNPDKALAGMMYARNAIAHEWMEDVQIVFFGPSEELLSSNEEVAKSAAALADITEPLACKYISDQQEVSDDIAGLGVGVEYVGTVVSDYIKQGYTPMVW